MAGADRPDESQHQDERERERLRKRDRIRRFARRAMPVPLAVRTSDLPKRTVSAIVMLALAAYALSQGGITWTLFVMAIAAGVLIEWYGLARRFTSGMPLVVWTLAGIAYLGAAGFTLVWLERQGGFEAVLLLAGAVIATDIGAYFAGRTIGGPKIAPRISPSKTWAGLGGGALAATGFFALYVWLAFSDQSYVPVSLYLALLVGPLCAIVAQAGDFFESWMKRRAGVKDSGRLIPGHGGLFDRMDGMMAVAMLGFPFTMVVA